jgi:hypothetical protein
VVVVVVVVVEEEEEVVVVVVCCCSSASSSFAILPHACPSTATTQRNATRAPLRRLRPSVRPCLPPSTPPTDSVQVVGKVDLGSRVTTEECGGKVQLKSCCTCMSQGWGGGGTGLSSAVSSQQQGQQQQGQQQGQKLRHEQQEQGQQGHPQTSPKPAFLHVCIPTTPRVLDGQDIDFLHIMLQSLDEQVLDQAGKKKDNPAEFGGAS